MFRISAFSEYRKFDFNILMLSKNVKLLLQYKECKKLKIVEFLI